MPLRHDIRALTDALGEGCREETLVEQVYCVALQLFGDRAASAINALDPEFSLDALTGIQLPALEADPALLVFLFEALQPKSDRQKVGAFFTPLEVVEDALAHLEVGEADLILDPACGAGAFLLGTVRTKGARAHQIYGSDSDESAVRVARLVIALELGSSIDVLRKQIVVADGLFHDWNKCFDFIIGNPPWISLSGKHRVEMPQEYLDQLKNVHSASQRGWPTIHGAFLEAGARGLSESGSVLFVMPRQVRDATGFMPLRENLTNRGFRLRFKDVPDGTFEGVTAPAVLLLMDKPTASDKRSFAVHVQTPLDQLYESLNMKPKMPEACFGDIGVHSGNAAKLILNRDGRGKALLEGRDIQAGVCAAPSIFLDIPEDLPPERYFRAGDLERQRATPILLRQTARYPIATVNLHQVAFRNSILACFGIPELDDDVLVELLNGPLLRWYHVRSQVESRQKAFPQVKVSALRGLPMPNIDLLSGISPSKGDPKLMSALAYEFDSSMLPELENETLRLLSEG